MKKEMWKKFLPITMAVVIFATSLPVDAFANTVSQNTVTQEEQTQSTMPMAEVVDANGEETAKDIFDNTSINMEQISLEAAYTDPDTGEVTVLQLTENGDFTLPYNADIDMTLNFVMGDGNVVDGETAYVYKLPSSIRVDVEDKHELKDTAGKSIGNVQISKDGTLTFHFYEEQVAGNKNIKFYVQFEGGLSEELQESGKETEVSFPTSTGGFDFTITTTDPTDEEEEVEPKDYYMGKSGAQIVDNNGKKVIEWTIELRPEGRDSIDGTIIDTLPEGLEYVKDSAYVVAGGNTYNAGTLTESVTEVNGRDKVEISVQGIQTYYNSYVKFQTTYDENAFQGTITNDTKLNYDNTAVFNPDDGTTGVTDSGAVDIKPEILSKKGAAIDTETNTIEWTVVVNKEQLDISNATYTDTFGVGQTLVGNVEISGGDTGKTTILPGQDGKGFQVTFAEGTSDTYTITYKTKVENITQQSFKNTAKLTGGTDPEYDYTVEATVPGLNLLDKYGAGYNDVTSTLTWKIVVNTSNATLNDVVVTDTFDPAIMEFVSATAPLNNETSNVSGGKLSFVLGDITEQQTITVVTRIINPEQYNGSNVGFHNNVTLSSGDLLEDIKDSASQWIVVKEPELASKDGQIKDGIIEWTIEVKSSELTVENISVEDYLPEGTEYIEGTFRIQNQYYDANPLYRTPTVTTENVDGVERTKLSFTLGTTPNATDAAAEKAFFGKAFWIVYQTRVSDYNTAAETNTYKNDANVKITFEGEITVEDPISDEVTGIVGGVLDKTFNYRSGEQYVDWTVSINEGRRDLSEMKDPIIRDQLADYFDYVEGTLYIVNIDGTEEAVDKGEYFVSAVNNQLIVQLPKKADGSYMDDACYRFKFRTRFNVMAIKLQGQKINNTVSFESSAKTYVKESSSVENVSFSSSTAGSVVEREIRVKKVDANDPSLVLPGAKFELYLGDVMIAEATSDSEGYAVFENLDTVYGYTLTLKEIQAPDGYVVDANGIDPIVFTEENMKLENGVYYVDLVVDNAKEVTAEPTGSICIKKVDVEGNALPGAEFGLYRDAECKTEDLIKSRNVEADGTLEFGELQEGTYYVKEINSPAGYVPSDEVITAILTKDVGTNTILVTYTSNNPSNQIDANATEVTVVNEKAKASLKIVKTGADTGTGLANATFAIYKDELCTDRVAYGNTDADGVVIFENLELGRTYYYRETAAPDGYVLDNTIHDIAIGTGTEVADVLETVEVDNQPEIGNILVRKIDDSVIPVPLEKVQFQLFVIKDGVEEAYQIDNGQGGTTDYILSTDENGVAKFENLPFGEYVIKEITGLDGYVKAEATNVTVNTLEDKEVTIVNEKMVANIQVKKEGPNAEGGMVPLAGAEFGLYTMNDVQIARGITDEQGVVIFGDISYGQYYVKELKAPEGYILDGDNPKYVLEDDFNTAYQYGSKIIAKDFENARENGSVQVQKVTAGDTTTPLPGAEFTIYDENGIQVSGITNPVTTGDDGYATFEKLLYGTYYIEETKAPLGYVRDTKRYKVIVADDNLVTKYEGENGQENLVIENVQSHAPQISFKFIKVDSQNGKPVANATFELFKNDVATGITAVSDEKGMVYFRQAEIRDDAEDTVYTVKEVSSPTGYVDSSIEIALAGSKTEANTYGDPPTGQNTPLTDEQILWVGGSSANAYEVDNEPHLGSIKVTKTGSTSATPLQDAEFTLYDENKQPVMTNGAPYVVKTDSNGVATFTNLRVGNYYIKETKAPAGYTLNVTETKVTITDSSEIGISYKDTPINVYISKKAVGGTEELMGANFLIYKEGDAERKPVDSWTTAGKVHRIAGKLEVGQSYVLTEILAPQGYGYMEDVVFEVNNDGSITITSGSAEKNGQTIVLRDREIVAKISKKASDVNDKELVGAILAVYDTNGVEVLRFTTSTNVYEIPVGKLTAPSTDGSYNVYTLKELSAPDGYEVAADIKFAIDKNGKLYTVDASGTIYTEEVDQTIEMVDEKKPEGTIYIRKLNAKTGTDITGATLQIYEGDNALDFANWVSDGKPKSFKCEDGTNNTLKFDTIYTLKEEYVPAGYLKANDIQFKIENQNDKAVIVIVSGGSDALNGDKDTIMMRDQQLELKIRKQDVYGTLLNGATLELWKYDENTQDVIGNAPIDIIYTSSVVYSVDATLIESGNWYVLKETDEPDGYTKAPDIVFRVKDDGSLERTDNVPVYNSTIVMEDKATTGVSIKKVDLKNRQGLAGSTLQLTSVDDAGFTTKEWISDGSSETWELIEFTPGCTYTLTELKAPLGYALTDPIVFTIDATDHQIYINGELAANRTVHIADGKLELAVNKLDFYSKENVKGAKLGVYDTNGNLITSWTSGVGKIWIDTSKMVVQADDYQEYILREIEAPAGYKKADDIHFAFDRDGKVYLVTEDPILGTKQYDEVDDKTLVMYDVPYIRVEKVDTDGNPVVGAKLQITAKDDASFTPVTWTTDGKPYWFADNTFKEGVTYVLTELEAPAGYVVAEPVEFTVDADNNLYVKGQKVLNRRIVMIDQKAATGGGAPGSSSPIIGNVNTTLPKTGDGTPLGTLMLFMAFGLFGACMTFGGYLRRKYRKSE